MVHRPMESGLRYVRLGVATLLLSSCVSSGATRVECPPHIEDAPEAFVQLIDSKNIFHVANLINNDGKRSLFLVIDQFTGPNGELNFQIYDENLGVPRGVKFILEDMDMSVGEINSFAIKSSQNSVKYPFTFERGESNEGLGFLKGECEDSSSGRISAMGDE
jgi:hypothetical protein